jgi:FkbM family methyltransferase
MRILQIGAHTGNDHVTKYVTDNPYDFLVLVEANPNCIELLKTNYLDFNNIEILNLAVVADDQKSIELHLPSNDLTSQHTSNSKEHLSRHGHRELEKVVIDAQNINDLLDTYFPINRLYIDVEGFDIDLVNALDFSTHLPEYLEFEYIHSDGPLSYGGEKLTSCVERLEKLGYLISKIGYNVVAERL